MQTTQSAPPLNSDPHGGTVVAQDKHYGSNLLRDLQRVRSSYFRLRAELEKHQKVTRPAYYTWYQERFGALDGLVQQLRLTFAEKSALVQRMNALYSWRGFTRQKAFAQANRDHEAIKARREREEQRARDDAAEEALRGRGTKSRDVATETSYKDLEPSAEIKTMYRKLARVLHPDRSGGECVVRRSFWQETQDAYQARDLDKLKLIWNECLIEVDAGSEDFQLLDLKVAYTRLRNRFHQAQKEKLELAKTDPTWRFDKKDLHGLAASIESELLGEKVRLTESIDALEREMRAFSREHVPTPSYDPELDWGC